MLKLAATMYPHLWPCLNVAIRSMLSTQWASSGRCQALTP